MTVNTANDSASGTATLQVAGGTVQGNIAFSPGGYLNSIGLTGTGFNIPLGIPGLTLQSIGASLDHLSPTDPAGTTITGILGVGYGTTFTANVTATVVLDTNDNVDDINGKANASFDGGARDRNGELRRQFRHGQPLVHLADLAAFHNSLVFQGCSTGLLTERCKVTAPERSPRRRQSSVLH